MKLRLDACPSPPRLERAFWSGDARVRRHVVRCARCSAIWAEIAALVEIAREVPPPSWSEKRRQETRTSLLSSREQPQVLPTSRRWTIATLGAAVAVAIAVAGWWWVGPGGDAPPPSRRATVLAHDGARYRVESKQPDEILRLVDGSLSVSVDPMRPGQRFRIVTGEVELEIDAEGAALDVTAKADHLQSARVMRGTVDVRAAGSDGQTITAGQAWQSPPGPYLPDRPYEPRVASAELSPDITHPLFPAPVGARWIYEAITEAGRTRIVVAVERETKTVWGATARVVRDTEFIDDQIVEDTWDWFAQDAAGHVWYLGEDTSEYAHGRVVSQAGAWESGVGGARPGLVMLADPKVGNEYRQEYLSGEAEDYARVVSRDAAVTVRAGTFTGCLRTRDRSAIDPELDEFKYYCAGVGNVLVEEGATRLELVEYSGL